MAKPFVLYKNTIRTSIGENNNLNYYKVFIRDKVLPSDANRNFKSEGGFNIDYPTNDSKPNDIFYGSNCTVPFLVEDSNGQAFIDDLIQDQESRFLLEIIKTDGITDKPFWRGVFVADELEHENKNFPYLVNLVAIDGISQLKERKAPNIGGFSQTISGGAVPKSLLESFIEFLNQTSVIDLYDDTDELVVTSMRWFESDMVGNNVDPIANMRYPTYKLEWDYDDFNNVVKEKSFDVLRSLFSPLYCRIIQLNGSYHLIQLNNYDLNVITVYRYAKNYQRNTQDPNVGAVGVISSNESLTVERELNNSSAITSGIYTQEEGALFRYFGAAERVTSKYIIDQSEQTITKNLNFGSGLNNTDIDVFSNPNLTIDFDFEIFVNYFSQRLKTTPGSNLDFSFNLRTVIQLVVSDGLTPYYYDEISGLWTTTQKNAADFITSGVMAYANVAAGSIADGNTNTFINTLINAQTPPINGSLFCRIDVDYVLGSGINQFMTNRNVYNNKLIVAYDGNIGELVTYTTENTLAPDSSIVIELGNQKIGDQVGDTFWGCWLVWDGVDFNKYSQSWSVEKQSGGLDIISLLNKEVLSIRRKPTSAFDVVLLGDYNPIFSVLYNSEKYAFMGGTFNSKIGYWDSTLLQLTYNNSNINTTVSNDTSGDLPTLKINGNEIQNRLNWRGDFATVLSQSDGSPTLAPNDVTLQDGWLAVATTETTDSPAPTINGDPFVLMGENFSPTITTSNSVITSGHTYTFVEDTFVSEILVYPTTIAANWSYRVFIKDLSSGSETILDSLTLVAGQWNPVSVGNTTYAAGTELLIYLETTHSSGSATYAEEFSFWDTYIPPAGFSVLPYLEFGGVPQTPEVETAMGVDIKIQDVTFSENYNILAYSNFFEDPSTGASDVESVNGQTGVVSLDLNDLTDVSSSGASDGDIIVYRNASGQFVLEQKPAAGTNPAWGDITGTLSSQTDLQAALDLKVNNGDLSTVATSGNYNDLSNKPITITAQQAADITANNAKISYTDAAQVATNTSNISTIQGEQVAQDSAIALNTAKRSYPLSDENKLTGIQSGAEVNVKSDWNATSGDAEILNKPTIPASAPVDSVNGKIGVVVLDTDDISEGTNKYTTQSDINRLANTSGTNTGDQDISGIATNASDIMNLEVDVISNTSDIATIQTQQTAQDAAIALNTAKRSYPLADENKLAGIEDGADANVKSDWNAASGDAEILNKPNTITTAQANAITANTAKRSYPLADENRLANTSGTNTGDQDISGIATNASNISNLAFDVSANTSDITANGSNIASNTAAIITNANNIVTITDRANQTGTQPASTISDFDSASNAVIGGFSTVDDGYEVEETDNNSVLSYDDSGDGNIVLNDNSLSSVSVGFKCKVIQSGSGLITFQTSGSSTIKSLNSAVETIGEGSMVEVIKISTNGWLISGDIQ